MLNNNPFDSNQTGFDEIIKKLVPERSRSCEMDDFESKRPPL
jgi:hypothetical protein